jgi:hypothetical protein
MKGDTEMSKEELLQKNKDEVMQIAKGIGISCYIKGNRKSKEMLIDEIIASQSDEDEEWTPEEKETPKSVSIIKPITKKMIQSENDEKEIPDEKLSEIVEDISTEQTKSELTEEERLAKKKAYIENVKIGALVAFNSTSGKVKSAKVIKRSTKDRKLKVETKYGASFVISFDDVIWVRTSKRWPKGVYQLLKGVNTNEAESEEE